MFSKASLLTIALSVLSAVAAPVTDVVEARAGCDDVYAFFARGTTETGTLGTVVGPGFGVALAVAVSGSLSYSGVPYAAIVSGYLAGGDRLGAATLANSVNTVASSCPNAKIVISGYSQGAQVVHLAARQLSSTVQNRINAVVTFGDPYRDTALPGVLQSRRKTFCAFGDLICAGQPIVLAPHLTYGSDVAAAAAFVRSQVQ